MDAKRDYKAERKQRDAARAKMGGGLKTSAPLVIAKVSKTNVSYDSNGKAWTSSQIDSKIRKAKEKFLNWFEGEHGYHFCEQCHDEYHEKGILPQDGCKVKIDVSHTISVKEAKESGRTELCWDWENNFRLLGRRHHQIHDKTI